MRGQEDTASVDFNAMNEPVYQDFALLKQWVDKVKKEQGLQDDSNAFYFVVLQLLLDLQDDEVDDAITDHHYQKAKKRRGGKDRGIDAIWIETQGETTTVHLFSFKYASTFEASKGFFDGNEIDKIESFLADLMAVSPDLKRDVNPSFASKIEEIFEEIDHRNPNYEVHICTNRTEGFEPRARERFEKILARYSNISPRYHTQSSLAARMSRRGRVKLDGRIKAIDQHLFEIEGGDVRALILHVDAVELLRFLSDRDQLRNNASLEDYSELVSANLCEEAFEDNIRLYLRQRSRVNRNIKASALAEDNNYFFYYNNGITITCDRLAYPKKQRAPIVEVENIQVVNGGQTLHALSEAYKENQDRLSGVELLCRLYETKNLKVSSKIAECTNSQNPVKGRDIRSIDLIQIKLEKEFEVLDMFYERKKNQFVTEAKERRIDSEKCGQVMLAFYEYMPQEAKNKKGMIFGEKYDQLFSDETTADRLLLPIDYLNILNNSARCAPKANLLG
jgi:hypothetical protein